MDGIDRGINGAQLVTPDRDHSSRATNPSDFSMELFVIEPVRGLSNGNQIHASIWQAAVLGWLDHKIDSRMRRCRRNLIRARVAGVNTREVLTERVGGLTVAGGDIPG